MEVKQKCPFNNSEFQVFFRWCLMFLGTVGLYFLNIWVAVVYLVYYAVFFFLAMPLKHCQYCYYKVKETTVDEKTGNKIRKLLSKEEWKECCLEKHVDYAKKWGFNFFILWVFPIVLIIISFFLNFSIYALLSLIGFIVVLAVSLVHMRWKVCPSCAIVEECHSAF